MYYYKKDEKVVGPISTPMLRDLCQAGTITADTLVRRDSMDRWVPANQWKGLLPDSPSTTSTSSSFPHFDKVENEIATLQVMKYCSVLFGLCGLMFMVFAEPGYKVLGMLGLMAALIGVILCTGFVAVLLALRKTRGDS